MPWHDHSRQMSKVGDHALYSGSKYAWIRDRSKEEALHRYYSSFAPTIGTVVHELAANMIRTNTRLTKQEAKKLIRVMLLTYEGRIEPETQNLIPSIPPEAYNVSSIAENFVNFVNDAIGFMMKVEVPLWHSEYAFGKPDAIIFDNRKKLLRIHDLKTGSTPAKFDQLEVYAAFYCLDYDIRPSDISFEFRIYQGGEILVEKPDADVIVPIMESAKWHTDLITELWED